MSQTVPAKLPQLPGVRLLGVPPELLIIVDLPGVAGQGRLWQAGRQWRGTVGLSLGPISVTGLAVLDPGDPPSLIVLLAAEFQPAIQLSFGVTLVGVGGVVGVNRRADHEQLRQVMIAGDLGELLFPGREPSDNARVLALVDRCFTVSRGSYVVGPTLKLGWGAFVSATLGVLTSDRDITVLGRIAVGLPTVNTALVRLEANVVGRIDSSGLAIDAALVNSHLVGIPLEGDLRLRLLTGGSGLFAFSAGGFHPAFPVPPGMAGMRRIGTHLEVGSIFHARLEAYLAVTTNSVQFGARMEVRVGVPGWKIHGHAAFDALFRFDPFRFETTFQATVSVQAAGIDLLGVSLAGELSGPAPWRISGRARVKLLFLRVPVPFPSLTWGPREHHELPPAPDPLAVLLQELRQPQNWSAATDDGPLPVRLAAGGVRGGRSVPSWSVLTFTQHRVPLRVPLSRMDGSPLGSPVRLDLSFAGEAPGEIEVRHEAFARRQFFTLDDAERLGGAGYDEYPAGFAVPPPEPVTSRDTAQVRGERVLWLRTGGQSRQVNQPAASAVPDPLSQRATRALWAASLRARMSPAVLLSATRFRFPR